MSATIKFSMKGWAKYSGRYELIDKIEQMLKDKIDHDDIIHEIEMYLEKEAAGNE